MSGIQAAAANVPAATAISLRRPLLIAAGFAVVGLVVCGVLGHIVMGILIGVGMLMGAFNVRLLQRAITKEIEHAKPSRRAVGLGSAKRLMGITVIALALGYFVRPDGLGVFFGLVIFQFVFVGNLVLPAMWDRHKHGDSGTQGVPQT